MEPFSRNVALLAESNPLLAATIEPGAQIAWGGAAVSGSFDVVFLEGVEKAPLLFEYSCKVVVTETSPEKLGGFLDTEMATQCLEHPRFSLAFVPNENAYLQLAWEHVFLSHYAEGALMQEYLSIVHCIASDYRDFGAKIFQNLLHNAKAPLLDGASLQGAFAGVPAIVCGAGPSLEKNPDTQSALVFACGSAMGLVSDYHFGVALDPDPPLDRFLAAKVKEAPLLMQNRLSHKVVAASQGPLISFPPNGNYPVEDAIFGERGTFASGWNAGTFGVALAHFFGCDPIYTTGIDGGYVGGRRYAEGIDADGSVDDLSLGRAWIAQFSPKPLEPIAPSVDVQKKVAKALAPLPRLRGSQQIVDSVLQCATIIDDFISDFESVGKRLLHEALLLRELFYETHLEPLWKIWHWVIEREGADRVNFSEHERLLNKMLFFQRVVKEYHVR